MVLTKFEVRVTSLDCLEVLGGSVPALVYLDPPYFQAGRVCYRNSFNLTDHQRLAAALRRTNHQWVLSYDDCPEIRDLYRWARIVAIPVKYSIAGSRDESELLITKNQ
jgi:DNA adenine methylase